MIKQKIPDQAQFDGIWQQMDEEHTMRTELMTQELIEKQTKEYDEKVSNLVNEKKYKI